MNSQQNNLRIRVLHVYRTYFPDPPGGLQEAIRQICLASSAFNVETRIFTLSPQPVPQEIDAPEGRVIRYKSWAAPASCDLGGVGSLLRFRELASWADVIHYHFPWPFADVLHQLGGKGKPTVMTYHSDIVRQRYLGYIYGPLMRRTTRSMSAVVATSPAYAKTSPVLTTVVPQGRLHMIPLGIVDHRDDIVKNNAGHQYLAQYGLNDKPFILSLGVLRYYKGLHTLIEAANSIRGTIVIAGSGPEDARLKTIASKLGVSNVIFVGQVSNSEKVALLSQCRALTLPSHLRSEAFGMVLVEASIFGKPMVCCEVQSGTSFVNIHGETGFVVPPESPKDLAVACNELLEDKTLALRMGAAARKRYEQLFSGEALGHAYAKLYREITA